MSKVIKINGKFYDFGTRNKSFLITAQELKSLGVKNWYFMLEVKNPQLLVQDLDTWSPDLTPEQIGRIHIENKQNIWYYVREVAKVPAKGSPKPFDPILTRASAAAVWCYDHNIDFRLCQPRQTHKSTWATLIMTHSFLYDVNNADIPFLHIKDSRAQDNARTFRDYITEGLPSYMNPWLRDKRLPGLKSIRYDAHKVGIKIIASAESPEKAMDLLRGNTVGVSYWDEYEYIKYIESIISGGAPAMHSARDIAMQTGGKACSIYTSTPGNLDTAEGKASQAIINRTPRFSEKYYDLSDDEIDYLFENVTEGGVSIRCLYIEFNWKQLRKTEKWVQEQYNEALVAGKLDEYRRGVLLQRFRGGFQVLFRQEDFDYIMNNVKTPDYEVLLAKKYILYVYKHEIHFTDLISDTPYFDLEIPYLIGIDVATGSGGDNTAFVIIHPYTLQIVGESKSPYMSTTDCTRVIVELASLLPRAVFCIESNHVGKAIISFVEESSLIDRFYHDPKLDISKNAVTIENDPVSVLKKRSETRQYIGTSVTPTVRNSMMTLLRRYVRDYRHLLTSRFLAEDISNLVINKNGKIEANAGEHDDIVMAYLHTIYVLTYGSKLDRFGIDKTKCTYETAFEVVNDYDDKQDEYMQSSLPCDSEYERQLLDDINRQLDNSNNVDEYGYRRSQYAGVVSRDNDSDITLSDLAFLREVNNF